MSTLATTRRDVPATFGSRNRLRGWVVRHPLSAFLILGLGLAYPAMAVPILAARGVIPGGSLPAALHIAPDELAGLLLTLVGLLPAALIVTWAADGRAGIRRLLSRMRRWRVGVGWWLLVLTGLPLLTVAIGLLLGDSLATVDPVRFIVSQLVFGAVNLALVNLWEETAWAGVVQTRLERRHSLFVAALLTAIPFGFAHWPLAFFGPVTLASAAIALLTYLAFGVIFRPMLAVVMRGARDSVLLVAVMHTVFNRVNNDNGIAAGLLTGDTRQLAAPLAAILLTAATAVIIRGRLGRAFRRQLDTEEH
jgi:membrane protease YdiL (CAAX protease family)